MVHNVSPEPGSAIPTDAESETSSNITEWLWGLLIGGAMGMSYWHVAHSCVPLQWRLILQMMMFASVFLMLLMTIASIRFYRRAYLQQYEQFREARITRIERLSDSTVMKSIACIKYVDHDCEETNDESVAGSVTEISNAVSEGLAILEEEKRDFDTSVDNNSLSIAVLVNPTDSIQVGDILTVSLLDGDPSQPLHLPYMRAATKQMFAALIKMCSFFFMPTILALRYSMPGISVVFARQTDLELFFRSCWLCTLGTGDMNPEDVAEMLSSCCSIDWSVQWSYWLLIGAMLGFYVFIAARVVWRVRSFTQRTRGVGYQMLNLD